MSAHTRWRVRFDYTVESANIRIAEVEFYNAVGRKLYSPTILVSEEFSASSLKEKAFDESHTDGGWSSITTPAWIGLQFATPQEITYVRLTLPFTSSASDNLPVAEATFLEWSDDGTTWVDTGLTFSGNFTSGGRVTAGANLLRGALQTTNQYVQARAPIVKLHPTLVAPPPGRFTVRADIRTLNNLATGVISDLVTLKVGGAEVPFVNGRVWLLRLRDGRLAWAGLSDGVGVYTATHLEVGEQYVAVAIDPYGNQKATGAGPVTAEAAA